MISIRQFEASDAGELAGIMMEMVAFYGGPLAVEGSLADDIIRQAKNVGMAVALSDNQVVGFAAYGFLYPVAGLRSFAYLQQIYVAASYRRMGIAQELMSFVARVCRDRGCTWMEWSTGRDNTTAQAFYNGLGAIGSEKISYDISGDALVRLASLHE